MPNWFPRISIPSPETCETISKTAQFCATAAPFVWGAVKKVQRYSPLVTATIPTVVIPAVAIPAAVFFFRNRAQANAADEADTMLAGNCQYQHFGNEDKKSKL